MSCLSLALACAASAGAQTDELVSEAWVARYNGPANGQDGIPGVAGNLVAADSQGNVYVTGGSEGQGTGMDFATVKYDAEGSQLWVARYNGAANGDDYTYAMAVDGEGNVHVTGDSNIVEGAGGDFVTIKYDSNGQELWAASFNGPADGTDVAVGIAVDTAGNVYVTGLSYGVDTGSDIATIKYDAKGSEVWVARYNGPESQDDSASALAVDGTGNVYVAGHAAVANGQGGDYVTIKYDMNGNQVWVARYDGPGAGSDGARAMDVDRAGNVCVTGDSDGDESWGDYATVKYDASGNEVWVARYNGPGNSLDMVRAIGVDERGNVYVTGGSSGSDTGTDYATVKYDPDGRQVWVARYEGPGNGQGGDGALAMAVDEEGNVYVTGYSDGGETSDDYATVKYDAAGRQVWVARYDGPKSDDDFGQAIFTDGQGNVYVTGPSRNEGADYDLATVKYVEQPAPTPTPTSTLTPSPTPSPTPTSTPTPSPMSTPARISTPAPGITPTPLAEAPVPEDRNTGSSSGDPSWWPFALAGGVLLIGGGGWLVLTSMARMRGGRP